MNKPYIWRSPFAWSVCLLEFHVGWCGSGNEICNWDIIWGSVSDCWHRIQTSLRALHCSHFSSGGSRWDWAAVDSSGTFEMTVEMKEKMHKISLWFWLMLVFNWDVLKHNWTHLSYVKEISSGSLLCYGMECWKTEILYFFLISFLILSLSLLSCHIES